MLFATLPNLVIAQTKKEPVPLVEVEPKEKLDRFIRVGIDPTRLILSFLQTADRGGLELSLDIEAFPKFYGVLEGGYDFVDRIEPDYHYKVDGFFGRAGFDYNLINTGKKNSRDIFFMGLRFAGSSFRQGATDVVYTNRFGSVTTEVPAEYIHAYWSEFVMGVKVEAFKRFYVGWTARGKIRYDFGEHAMMPYIIPGFGTTSSSSSFNGQMNIYLLYAFRCN